jgi:hypothetical protein
MCQWAFGSSLPGKRFARSCGEFAGHFGTPAQEDAARDERCDSLPDFPCGIARKALNLDFF